MQDPVTGQDELGTLLVHATGAYWYGSTLTVDQAKSLACDALEVATSSARMQASSLLSCSMPRPVVHSSRLVPSREFALCAAPPPVPR